MTATTPVQTETTPVQTEIILENPHMPLDVRLRVFDTEFLVHSPILKLHSGFFAACLDSPDKTTAPADDAKFKYEWVTKVKKENANSDEDVKDGSNWFLTCAGPKADDLNLDAFTGNKEKLTLAFKRILLAIYSQPWSLDDCSTTGNQVEEFKILVSLAAYYRALPILSSSLHVALSRSPLFVGTIATEALDYLTLAVQLRHIDLFHDCLMYCLGPWEDPRYREITDRKLLKVAKRAHNALSTKILEAQETIYRFMSDAYYHANEDTVPGEMIRCLHDATKAELFSEENFSLPLFFHSILRNPDGNQESAGLLTLQELAKPLEDDNARIRKDKLYDDGYNLSDGFFRCTDIDLEDLPWDVTEKVW